MLATVCIIAKWVIHILLMTLVSPCHGRVNTKVTDRALRSLHAELHFFLLRIRLLPYEANVNIRNAH